MEIRTHSVRHTKRNNGPTMPPRRSKTNPKNGSSSPATRAPATAGEPPAPSPPERGGRIRIARRVGARFSPRACMLGFGYFARDAVVLARVTEDEVDAVVRGQRTHDVRLRASADGFGELFASCTCTPASLGTNPCRHLWAAILEVDRRGALACLRRSASSLLLSDLADDEGASAPGGAPPLPTTSTHEKHRPRGKPPTRSARPTKKSSPTKSSPTMKPSPSPTTKRPSSKEQPPTKKGLSAKNRPSTPKEPLPEKRGEAVPKGPGRPKTKRPR